jgi:DNA-binding transcriptional ArsR family regulator
MAVTKALADENRVRMLLALKDRELCVCQIIELFGLAPSTVSKHMSILRQAQLVEGRKEGRWMHYRLAGDRAPLPVRSALAWLAETLAREEQIRSDAKRLKAILKLDPQELCAAQCRK